MHPPDIRLLYALATIIAAADIVIIVKNAIEIIVAVFDFEIFCNTGVGTANDVKTSTDT